MDKKKTKTRPPRSRPVISQISQPAVEDSSLHATLSAFSPTGFFFAFVSLAVDKHCLRIYDTALGKSVAEHIIDSAKVTTLSWNRLDLSEQQQPQSFTDDESGPPMKKKRKKRNSQASDAIPIPKTQVDSVLLGLSSGSILLFSPTHGRILRTFSHPTSTSPILSVVAINSENRSPSVWASCADGVIRVWHAQRNEIAGTWKIDDRLPYSSMAARSGLELEDEDDDSRVDMLVANHSIHLLSLTRTTSEIGALENRKPIKLASFTGHASSTTSLHWDASQRHPNRFFSTAEGDRFINIWEVPSTQSESVKEGKLVASIPLDSYVRSMSLSSKTESSTAISEKQLVLTLSASGKVYVFSVPSELTPPASTKKTQHKIPTLLPRTTVSVSSKRTPPARVVAVSFHHQDVGGILVAAMVGGAKPIFEVIKYLDDSGDFIRDLNVVLDDTTVGIAEDSQMVAPNKRYAEHPSIAVQSGVEIGHDEKMDDLPSQGVDGDLDVDLAELSLGERLTALTGHRDTSGHTDHSSESDNEGHTKKDSSRTRIAQELEVPATSLTRTLIQALHSSDSRLLETCLKHSDRTLIRNTVRRLPPQLAEPLINACVERLGRGARGANVKGRGGGASSQRGTALIAWVRTVLAVHSGHLMTMPDLVARLSALHSTITTRLSLQESLLSLSGRLDMVLSQVEMRSCVAPAPLAPRTGKKTMDESEKIVARYVEGESEEEDKMEVEVEKDSGDEARSVEDVELGGDSQGEESEESEEDSEGNDESEDQEPTVNGFIDDEAEEYTDEDEDGEGDEEDEEEEESE